MSIAFNINEVNHKVNRPMTMNKIKPTKGFWLIMISTNYDWMIMLSLLIFVFCNNNNLLISKILMVKFSMNLQLSISCQFKYYVSMFLTFFRPTHLISISSYLPTYSGNALEIWIWGCRCILKSSGFQNSRCT